MRVWALAFGLLMTLCVRAEASVVTLPIIFTNGVGQTKVDDCEPVACIDPWASYFHGTLSYEDSLGTPDARPLVAFVTAETPWVISYGPTNGAPLFNQITQEIIIGDGIHWNYSCDGVTDDGCHASLVAGLFSFEFYNSNRNVGFGGTANYAFAVPLPAALWLLLTALGVLGIGPRLLDKRFRGNRAAIG